MRSIAFILLVVLFFTATRSVSAAIVPTPKEASVQTRAVVGDFDLYLSGIIAPYASVSFISGGNVYKAVTADSLGRFVFPGIRINRGFSSFCLDAVDWRRLGESYTCFRITPAGSDITMEDVFLPPTMGLSHKEIAEGSPVVISGYSMPNAQIEIYINGRKEFLAADSNGFYTQKRSDFKQGSYELYAGAYYDARSSLLPDRKLGLLVLSVWEYYKKLFEDLINWLMNNAPLFMIPMLIILLLIVIVVVWWEEVSRFLHLRSRKLHHAWLVGY